MLVNTTKEVSRPIFFITGWGFILRAGKNIVSSSRSKLIAQFQELLTLLGPLERAIYLPSLSYSLTLVSPGKLCKPTEAFIFCDIVKENLPNTHEPSYPTCS